MPQKILCGDLAIETTQTTIHIDDKHWFAPGKKHRVEGVAELVRSPCRKRPVDPAMVVVHWTGGEGGIDQFMHTLLTRKVSAHFFIARDGNVWQLADLWDTETYHAKSAGSVVNKRAIGIEMQNAGVAGPNYTGTRGVYKDTIRGAELSVTSFAVEQLDVLMDILDALIDAGIIKREFPRVKATDKNDKYSVIRGEYMTDAALKMFRGVCGHYHVNGSGKYDPGLQPFRIMIDEGW